MFLHDTGHEALQGQADPRQKRLAATPLLLTRNAVVVSVHLRARAGFQEERGFCARGHLRTMNTAVALELTSGHIPALGRWSRDEARRVRNLRLAARLIVLVALPGEQGHDDERNEVPHVRAKGGLTFDMSGDRRQAKPAGGRPLDGGVRHHVA